MKQKDHFKNIIELNLAVLFVSTSGVLGKYIDLPVPLTIFLRSVIAGALLFLYGKSKGYNFKLASQDRISLWIGGAFLGAHWITYFYSLKLSNVAIAMLSLYTFPVMTALLEPILLKRKLLRVHILLGLIVLFGIYLIAPSTNMQNQYFSGICLGLLSAFFYSLRNILLKRNAENYNQTAIMFTQLAVVSVLLLPTIAYLNNSDVIDYLIPVVLLAVLTTAIGHTLFVSSLKKFSITSASLISSMQPVYGIILAFIFLSESPRLNTILGGLVIISTVIIESRRISRA